MIDRLNGQLAGWSIIGLMVNRQTRWVIGSMVNRSNSERLRGFDFRWTDRQKDGQTDICDCRVAFATEK